MSNKLNALDKVKYFEIFLQDLEVTLPRFDDELAQLCTVWDHGFL